MKTPDYEETIFMALDLVRDGAVPVYQQLVTRMRALILSAQVSPGTRIPASRTMAGRLAVSRVTVVSAMDQLVAEGYLDARRGSGLFVASDIPDKVLSVAAPENLRPVAAPSPEPMLPFQPASPDMRRFPHSDWARLFQRVWSNPEKTLLSNPDIAGWWPLRVEIARHLRIWRAIECQPDQVIITSGAAEAMQLVAKTLLKPGENVAREDPGYGLFDDLLVRNGNNIHTIVVDNAGFDVQALMRSSRNFKCVITTPSRQYPLGITMPLARRLALLNWAEKHGAVIIEDDYDSEYRYIGQPVPALMSLSRQSSVIYLGSFSKVFSKSLRLGYMVIPQDMTERFAKTLGVAGSCAALVAQPVLARFMEQGQFAGHIRRMRRLYGERQKVFVALADEHLSNWLAFAPSDAGMQLVGYMAPALAARFSDREICLNARKNGVVLQPLSASCSPENRHHGLLAGYAGFEEDEIAQAVLKLKAMLEKIS